MNKSILLFFIAPLFILASCNPNNAKVNNDLKKYFDSAKVDGCFALLNNQMGDITLYNMKMDTQRISPANTFDIFSTLAGVQAGVITNENTTMPTDTAHTPFTLKEAFHASYIPYFQSVVRQVGKDTMQLWIDSIGYGNKNISGPIDSFWLNNELKISPDEQLGLMSKLYFDKLPFQKYAQQMVRDIMLQQDNTLYRLSYGAGTGMDENNNATGWVTGWVEENRHVYFFVTLIKSKNKNADMKTTGINVTTNILKELGFFKGQK